MHTKKNLFGFFFLALAQIMVGVNIVFSKLIISSIPILILLLCRFIVATLFLLPLHWILHSHKGAMQDHFSKLTRQDRLVLLAQALSAGVLFNCLMLTGLHYTDANVAGIITSALPAIIAIMSWLILKEKISVQKSLSVSFATAGLALIAYDKLSGATYFHSFLGDGLILLSLLPEAGYYILCKRYPNRLPLFLSAALMNAINAILLIPSIFFVHWVPNVVTGMQWLVLLIIGVTSGLFYVFWFVGSDKVDSIMASLSTALMPVATVILAFLILGEQVSTLELSGMAMVMFSIGLYAKR